jgi:hypothetical protein
MNDLCKLNDVLIMWLVRVFNAFDDSEALNIVLTTGSGEITRCTKNEFETGDLRFMDISNRAAITIGRYVIHVNY